MRLQEHMKYQRGMQKVREIKENKRAHRKFHMTEEKIESD